MIFDKIENLDRYREFAEYGKLIRDFIKQDKSEHLAEGRYELDDENLFALVQTYETKDKDDAQMESHRNMRIFSLWKKAKSVFMWILQMNWRWKKTGHQIRTFCSTKKQGITGSIFLQKEHSDIMHRRMHICPA